MAQNIHKSRFRRFLAVLMIVLMAGNGLIVMVLADTTSSWEYTSIITIDNTENDESLTDYQVLVELDSENFDFTKAQPGGDDLRFTNQNNDQLPYWVESYDSSDETAKIWVKVDSIPALDTTTITMYYGNPDAEPESDGENTFEFFDDASYDKTSSYEFLKICEHSVGGYLEYQEANNRYYAYPTGDPGQFLRIKDITSMQNFAADVDYAHVHHLSCNQLGFLWGYQNNNQFYSSRPGTCTSPDSIDLIKYDYGLTDITPPNSFSGDVLVLEEWHHLRTKAYDGSFITSHSLENNIISGTDTTYGSGKIGFYLGNDHTGSDRSEHWFKNVRVRKYTSPEPTITVHPKTISINTNKYTYTTGDTMHLGLNVANHGEDQIVRLVIGLEGPTGSPFVLYNDLVILPEDLDYSNPNVWHKNLPNLPSGIYKWHAILKDPFTGETISHDMAPWIFVFSKATTEDITRVLKKTDFSIDFSE